MNAQTQKKTKQMVIAALFMAMACVATIAIQIPSPASGYVNMGDCVVLLGAWVMGPWYGMLAGGIGSMLADIFTGYSYYAPGTLVIKATMALVAFVIYICYRHFMKSKKELAGLLLSGIAAECVMVLGYFLYAWLLLGRGSVAALQSVPGNLVQAVFGILSAVIIYGGVDKTGTLGGIRRIFEGKQNEK